MHLLSSILETISKLGPVVAAASASIAAFGAIYVYRQYKRAQDWRKGDLAASLLSKLESDEELAFACQALDWGTGPLMVPKRYHPLMKKFNRPSEMVLDHDTEVLACALEPQLNEKTLASAEGLIYRHCFVRLFSHLGNIGRMVDSGQIDVADLHGIEFWLKALSECPYSPEGRKPSDIFQPAIAVFDYPTIPQLGRRMGIDRWDTYDQYRRSMTLGVVRFDSPDGPAF